MGAKSGRSLSLRNVEGTNGCVKCVTLDGVLVGIFQKVPGAGYVCAGDFMLFQAQSEDPSEDGAEA